jgi:signal transduction histidine kinase
VRSLAQIGEFLNVDTCRLFEYRDNSQALVCVASWLSPLGMTTVHTEPVEYESWPWWRNTIHRHGVVVIPDVSLLLESDQKAAAEYWNSRGVKAALSAPVLRGDEIMGEIAIDVLTGPRLWRSQDLYLLRIATELIVHARDRRMTASLLKQERDSLEERVMNRTRVLSSVLDITQTVSSTQTMEALVALVINRFKAAIPCDAVLLSELVRREGDISIFHPLKSEAGLAYDNRISELIYEPRVDVDLAASFNNRRPFIIHNTQAASPYAAAFRARFARNLPGIDLQVGSVMHAPMIVEDQVVGVMTVMSNKPGHFSENEAAIAMAFANQTAALLMRTRLRDRDAYAAALTERSRLARELHDSVSQALFGIVLGSKTVLGIIGASKAPEQDMLRDPIQYIYGLSEAALSEMRALIFELRPESLQTEGIIMAFEKQAEMVFARHKIKVRTELGRVEPELPLNVKEALYRIGSEALQNTVKHAHASVIDIRLAVRPENVTLDIVDDGAGFDTQAKFKGHYGLHTMRERAIQFGGSVEIESAPKQGTRVRVQFPLKRAGGLHPDPSGSQPSAAAA